MIDDRLHNEIPGGEESCLVYNLALTLSTRMARPLRIELSGAVLWLSVMPHQATQHLKPLALQETTCLVVASRRFFLAARFLARFRFRRGS